VLAAIRRALLLPVWRIALSKALAPIGSRKFLFEVASLRRRAIDFARAFLGISVTTSSVPDLLVRSAPSYRREWSASADLSTHLHLTKPTSVLTKKFSVRDANDRASHTRMSPSGHPRLRIVENV